MEYKAMLNFMSEDTLRAHLSHLDGLRSRLSFLKKCYPSFKDKTAGELASFRQYSRLPRELFLCALGIFLHEQYFSSFTEIPLPCREVKSYYTSENAFCYELLSAARETDSGFVYAVRDKRRGVRIVSDPLCSKPLLADRILSLDLSEHAYFSDYGFNRDEYLRRAIAYLDLPKLFSEDRKTS